MRVSNSFASSLTIFINYWQLTMVIHETLRLYPPAVFSIKEASEDIKFKELLIPQDSNIQIPIHILHQLPEIWGVDAAEFKPERFAQGISGACKSVQAYMPFGSGPRTCAGQHFALAELKVILSLILAKFSFSLSPSYHHSPAFRLVVEPGDGVILHMSKVWEISKLRLVLKTVFSSVANISWNWSLLEIECYGLDILSGHKWRRWH